MHHIGHTAIATHRLKHIPERNAAFAGHALLIANEVFNARHGSYLACFGFVISIAYAKQQYSCLGKALFQPGDGGQKAFLIVIIVTTSLGSHVEPILQNNEIVGTKGVE